MQALLLGQAPRGRGGSACYYSPSSSSPTARDDYVPLVRGPGDEPSEAEVAHRVPDLMDEVGYWD
jgi:hypothetical protein